MILPGAKSMIQRGISLMIAVELVGILPKINNLSKSLRSKDLHSHIKVYLKKMEQSSFDNCFMCYAVPLITAAISHIIKEVIFGTR